MQRAVTVEDLANLEAQGFLLWGEHIFAGGCILWLKQFVSDREAVRKLRSRVRTVKRSLTSRLVCQKEQQTSK